MICDLLIGSYNNYRHAIWETYFMKYIITYTTHVRLKHTPEIIKATLKIIMKHEKILLGEISNVIV